MRLAMFHHLLCTALVMLASESFGKCSVAEDEVVLLQTSMKVQPEGAEAALSPLTTSEPNLPSSDKIVILHIGKTGGSSVRESLQSSLNTTRAYFADNNGHSESYRELHQCAEHPNHVFAYFVRAPVQRYVSAWVSRFRMGGNKMFAPWGLGELEAFAKFLTPDELGRALSASDPATRSDAQRAMHTIGHVKWGLSDYWGGLENFEKCPNSTFFVGRTEHFDEDYLRLVRVLGDEGGLLSEVTEVDHAHRAPDQYAGFKHLSRLARTNLRKWYKEDYEIIHRLIKAGHLPSGYLLEITKLDMETEPYVPLNWLSFKTTWLASCCMWLVFSVMFLCFSLPFLIKTQGKSDEKSADLCGSVFLGAAFVAFVMSLTCCVVGRFIT
mmetsp:Transcript_41921/g.69497  ORF Transcript_41921/g.69497 Transcript_41921/m.69497 type:complete len:382 (+) Transcript_41921:56-1201(+)